MKITLLPLLLGVLLGTLSISGSAAETGVRPDRPTWKEVGPLSRVYGMIPPLACVNNKGESVKISEADEEVAAFLKKNRALSLSSRENGTKVPITFLYAELLSRTPPQMQNFNLMHECEHHRLGHIDAAFSSDPEEKMQQKMEMENDADCSAARKMRADLKYGPSDLKIITDYVEILMQYAGTPDFFIDERLQTLRRCFAN